MPYYIELNSAIQEFENDKPERTAYSREDVMDCLFHMDTADVTPIKHGKWIKDADWVACSSCGVKNYALEAKGFCYCPYCGIKMDLESI